MNLKEQTYICTLARCGTITKAAEELFLTAPALSMFLSNLEKNLGVRLFSRTGKTMEPTPIGLEYIRCARQMLQLKEEFDQKLVKETGVQQRTVRIGIQERRAISAVPWLLLRLNETLPGVNVVFLDGDYTELSKLFEQHRADYLFYTMEDCPPGAEYTVLAEEPILVAVPEGHPCCSRAKSSPELAYPYLDISDLDGETMILPPKIQSLRLAVDQIIEEAGLHPPRIIEIKHFLTILEMVSNGLGIGFNRLSYLKDMRLPENVRYYFLGKPPACSKLVLLYSKEKKNTLYHDELIEVFEEYLSQA